MPSQPPAKSLDHQGPIWILFFVDTRFVNHLKVKVFDKGVDFDKVNVFDKVNIFDKVIDLLLFEWKTSCKMRAKEL